MKMLWQKSRTQSKLTERLLKGRVPILSLLLIAFLGVLSFSVTDVRGQGGASFVTVPITADPIREQTIIGNTTTIQAPIDPINSPYLDQGSNNHFSPHHLTTHDPGTTNWDTRWVNEKNRDCPSANSNVINDGKDTGCGFGDALSIGGWTVRNNSDVCPDEEVESIRVKWDIIYANKNDGDTDGLLVSMFDNASNKLRNINTIPGGGGLYIRDKSGNQSKYIVKGSNESDISDPPYKEVVGGDEVVTGANEGDGTLGFKLLPGGNLTVGDINNRFFVYQWRDQSAGGYSGGKYELGRVITAPIQVDLIFDHEPSRAPCTPPPPKNFPYLQIEGSNVISGANFTKNETCIQDIDAATANIYTNGFHGDDIQTGLKGSSNAQYGVWASGNIGKDSVGRNTFRANYGYRRIQSGSIENLSDGLFASEDWTNPSISEYGNFYDGGSNPSLPCFDISADLAGAGNVDVSPNAAQIFLNTQSSGSKLVDGNPTVGNVNLSPRVHKTLIVQGDLTIDDDITYASPYSSTTVPSLKIIADNIFIKSGVTRVDAELVAMPTGDPTHPEDGIIDTCSDMVWQFSNSAFDGPLPGEWPGNGRMTVDSCKQDPSLVINGAIAARRILFKRTNGTLREKDMAADSTCYFANYIDSPDYSPPPPVITNSDTMVQRYQRCAAELVKFSPEAYISELNLNPSQSLQAVPVSTLELPPIN